MKTLVVVSRFNEDVNWTSELKHNVVIYDKSYIPIENSIIRPNIGREAETLLYYIISNYNNLPDITIFVQADPRGNPISKTYQEVIDEVNNIDYIKLNPLFDMNGIVDLSNFWLKNCNVLNDLLFETTEQFTKYSHGVHYAIPKENILNRPIDFYQYLYTEVIKFNNKELNSNCSSLDDGISAWTLEPIWGNIFNLNIKLNNNYKHENN